MEGLFPPPKKQPGGRLTREQANLMKELTMASQPRTARRQRGAGVFSFLIRPLLRLFGKKVTKQAAKTVAKRVAKKAAKKAATGTLTVGAIWATQKAFDQI